MAQLKRILFVLDMFGFFGGPERRAYRIAKGLKELGCEVFIVSIMKADAEVIKKAYGDGIGAYQLTNEGNKALKSYRIDVFLKLRKLIKNINPDAVLTFEFLADYTTKMALLGINLPIYTFIGSTVWKWERKWHRRVSMEHFVKKSRLYIVNSNTVKKNVIRVLPSTQQKIKVLYNPIDTNYFRPIPKTEKVKIRSHFGLGEDDFIVGSVVRFYNPKGADVLIEAFYKSGIDGKLVLVGDGPFKDKLKNLAKELGIGDRVVFLGAIEATPEVYGMFDICVVPSQKGGFDNVVIESMACGVPTVATVATGIGEIAIDKRDVVITSVEADSIADGINYAANNLDSLSKNGREFVRGRLDIKKIVGELREWMSA